MLEVKLILRLLLTSMFNKVKQLFTYLLLLPVCLSAQECDLEITGQIIDKHTGTPISFANIYVEEIKNGGSSDSLGQFKIEKLCSGEKHINISHIGCETNHLFLEISNDTFLQIYLDHNSKLINDITISGTSTKATLQEVESIGSEEITENSDKNLANMLESISGVSTLRTGNSISKPIVQGLYGNRLTILNNGVAQSGQQWGNDHSPEIDPLVANKISVIKGVGALEYQGSSLGSIVLVEPEKIKKDPHIHGKSSYFFESNGLGHGLNLQLESYSKKLAWKINGTLKNKGDLRSAKYYLNNTGNREANIALQLEKSFSEKWKTDLYFSSFNAKIGVLRGAHIGNLTDLENALSRDTPYFTEDKFSYKIEAPFQTVNHHLLKLHSKYLFNNKQWIDFNYAGQVNTRKEFDVRRSGRTDKPALSLRQISNFLELKYNQLFNKGFRFKTGIQFNIIDNTNIPETGILPLIPDYLAYESGAFISLVKNFESIQIEFGFRYDNIFQNVVTISSANREIIRYNNLFHNYSSAAGLTYRIFKDIELKYNLGFATRNPGVNELYSNGLHQGVSGIEEGDPELVNENSLKSTLSIDIHIKEKFFVKALGYFQNVWDYIYLNPQDEIRLTIRGAFPVFKYEQTNAQIYGVDFSANYDFHKNLYAEIKYSYIKGRDIGNDLPLIYMPSNNLFAAISYQLAKVGSFKNFEFELNNRYVFKQKNLLEEQDFSPAPKGYNLLGIKTSIEKQLKKSNIKLYLRVDNLLNTEYRDYLNRQRYFADDLGINTIAGINLTF